MKLVVLVSVVACGGTDGPTASVTQPVTTQNGVYQNGLSTNGVYQNGVYQNGVYQNGVYQNGVYQNGVYQNGVYQNGVYQNGVYQNGVYQNGVYQNGLWISGLWSNSTWQVGTNADALRTNAYTRQFFQYLYACAMPGAFDPAIGGPTDPSAQLAPGKYSTSLDPNNGTLACNASSGCDDPFYTCNTSTNTCVVALQGAIGVGVNADGTTWWNSGTCDESCQKWVSACLLARTNAYGAHVDISMRAPDDAPQAVKNALGVVPGEAAAYGLREGAYYGNVFSTTPVNAPPSPDYSGPTDGQLIATPTFMACAGPGSNIPEITKRFCSSQGDDAVIKVMGVCDGECSSTDAEGAMHGCDGYDQVITVYIHDPIAVCGNSVCEQGETATSCPTDCHAGGWGTSFPVQVDPGDDAYRSASNTAACPDGGVVISGTPLGPIDFGNGNTDNSTTFVAKFGADGTFEWHREVAGGLVGGIGLGVGVGPDGTVAITTFPTAVGDYTNGNIILNTFAADGSPLGTWRFGMGGAYAQTSGAPLVDADRNVILMGSYYNYADFGNGIVLSGAGAQFVAKISPTGAAIWATSIDTGTVNSIARDAAGNILLASNISSEGPDGLHELDGATGTIRWSKPGAFESVAADAAGNVFAASNTPAGHGFATSDSSNDFFVAKYAPDGTFQTVQTSGQVCSTGVDGCSSGLQPYFMKTDRNGNVVVAMLGGGSGLNPTFGPTTFETYRFAPEFIAAYATNDLHFVWAKEVPFVLGGQPNGMDISADGQVFLAGTFSGSMLVDDTLLINDNPLYENHKNLFVSAFQEPPLTDTTSPLIGNAIDQSGGALQTVPRDISTQATGPDGATVFFMPPTAIDSGGAGISVDCVPAPNTTYPIGTTIVACTASNALGYSSSAQFKVTVRDSLAPRMSNVPADITSDTAIVTYALPTATDQVDGDRPVTCSPASGSAFSGTTTVTCIANDSRGNSVQGTFRVTVTPHDTTPPVITVPSPITAEATGASGASVTYAPTATDETDGAVAVACTPASGSMFALGITTVSCSAHDLAGNIATRSFVVTVRDTTAPTITIPTNIAASATSANGAPVNFTVFARDLVDGSVATSCSKSSGSAFALGTTTVTCSAHDAHGNATNRSFTVTVTVSWGGLLLPINADGSAEFLLNTIVPVRFALTGASVNITNAVATVTLTKTSSTISGTHKKLPRLLLPTSGTTAKWNPLLHHYYFRYNAAGLTTGTYTVKVDFHDGVVHTTQISLGNYVCGSCENDGGDD